MADLAALQALHDWMRSNGCVALKVEGVEMHLGPKPIVLTAEPPLTPEQEQAQELADLLYSSNGDAEALMAMQRKTDERMARAKT